MQYETENNFLFENVCNKNHKYKDGALKKLLNKKYCSKLLLITHNHAYFFVLVLQI